MENDIVLDLKNRSQFILIDNINIVWQLKCNLPFCPLAPAICLYQGPLGPCPEFLKSPGDMPGLYDMEFVLLLLVLDCENRIGMIRKLFLGSALLNLLRETFSKTLMSMHLSFKRLSSCRINGIILAVHCIGYLVSYMLK